jgi:hypothetical protein
VREEAGGLHAALVDAEAPIALWEAEVITVQTCSVGWFLLAEVLRCGGIGAAVPTPAASKG